ncbi:MAG: hypothetical protein AABX16_00900, partial [Nanoarchaeota archaeon]
MINIGAVESMKKCLDLNNEKVAVPQRFVDFDVTSSFAHCNPNLTSDELFGYATIDRLFEKTDGKINLLLCDYDGTFPEKEKPVAFSLETLLVSNQRSYLERNVFSYAPLLFEPRVPLG